MVQCERCADEIRFAFWIVSFTFLNSAIFKISFSHWKKGFAIYFFNGLRGKRKISLELGDER